MPHIFWLVFCKGQTVGERVCGEGPCYLSEQPSRSPQGATLRNKNSMCGTQCVCVCVFWCQVLKTELSLNNAAEWQPCLMIKTQWQTMAQWAHRSRNSWNWRPQLMHECLHYTDHIISTPPNTHSVTYPPTHLFAPFFFIISTHMSPILSHLQLQQLSISLF